MSWEDILKEWRHSIPKEGRLDKVLSIVDNIFQEKKWKSGTHIKVTDSRLLFYKKKVHPQDDKVAPDGSFQIITKNKLVKGFYIKRTLHMIEIIEAYERWKNEKES